MLDAAGEIFAWQHDPEALGNDNYSFFDDEATIGAPELSYSRTVTVHLNQWTQVATLLSSNDQPEGLSATSQGNAEPTSSGDLVVGWGSLPYFSAFDPHGNLVFNASFPTGVNTYRAYLLPVESARQWWEPARLGPQPSRLGSQPSRIGSQSSRIGSQPAWVRSQPARIGWGLAGIRSQPAGTRR